MFEDISFKEYGTENPVLNFPKFAYPGKWSLSRFFGTIGVVLNQIISSSL